MRNLTSKQAPAPAPLKVVEERPIKLDQIRPSKDNPRKSIDADGLKALAKSIADQGVLQPILVRKKPDGRSAAPYEIVAGERRWRASKLAGKATIPARVVEATDEQAGDARLVENDQREDISPIDRAAAYQEWLDEHPDEGVEGLARVVGKAVSTVREALLLGRCPPKLAEAVTAGKVSPSVAGLVCRVPNAALRERISLHVLAGEGWYGERGAPKVPEGGAETLGYRDTKHMIHNHCMVELKGAPFDQGRADLVKGCPACEECPKRLGNLQKTDPTFAGGRADICMDPPCFQAKSKAAAALKVAEAKETGRKVLSPSEANRVFSGYRHGISHDAAYIDLDADAGYSAGNRTYRQVLKAELANGLGDQVVIGVDPEGRSHDLLAKEVAKAPLAKHKVTVYIPRPASKSPASKPMSQADRERQWKAQQQKAKLQDKIREEVRKRRQFAAYSGACGAWVGSQGKFLRLLVRGMIERCYGDLESIAKIVEVKSRPGDTRATRKAVTAKLADMRLEQLAGLVGVLLLEDLLDVECDDGQILEELQKLFIMDVEQIEKSVANELDPPLPGLAVNGKGAKAEPAATGASA